MGWAEPHRTRAITSADERAEFLRSSAGQIIDELVPEPGSVLWRDADGAVCRGRLREVGGANGVTLWRLEEQP